MRLCEIEKIKKRYRLGDRITIETEVYDVTPAIRKYITTGKIIGIYPAGCEVEIVTDTARKIQKRWLYWHDIAVSRETGTYPKSPIYKSVGNI